MPKTLTELRDEATVLNRTVSRREPGGRERITAAEDAWKAAARAEYAPDLNDAQWALVYAYAYDQGHAAGYSEIENYIIDAATLVTNVLAAS